MKPPFHVQARIAWNSNGQVANAKHILIENRKLETKIKACIHKFITTCTPNWQ